MVLAVVVLTGCLPATGTLSRITAGNNLSFMPSVSADGRYVSFSSRATNLVPGTAGGSINVFVWDRSTGTTTRITDGGENLHPAISGDGRYVAYSQYGWYLYLWDRETGSTTEIAASNGESTRPSISADGRFVAFESEASMLVPGDLWFGRQVLLWDRETQEFTRVSGDAVLNQAPSISADGRYVTYTSAAGPPQADRYDGWHVYVWDRETGTTTQVSDGEFGNILSTVSANGRYVAYLSVMPKLEPEPWEEEFKRDVFVWDRDSGLSTRLTDGDDNSAAPTISDNGQVVTFVSMATDLIPDAPAYHGHVYAWDRVPGRLIRITPVTAGYGSSSGPPGLSADGRRIVFGLDPPIPAPGGQGWTDLFIWSR